MHEDDPKSSGLFYWEELLLLAFGEIDLSSSLINDREAAALYQTPGDSLKFSIMSFQHQSSMLLLLICRRSTLTCASSRQIMTTDLIFFVGIDTPYSVLF